jgi:hypothetical protein
MGIKATLVSLAVSLCTGCGPGLLYTDIVRPECQDLSGTTLGDRRAVGGTKKFEIPTGDVDLKFSLLAGIWKQESIIIYGR